LLPAFAGSFGLTPAPATSLQGNVCFGAWRTLTNVRF
jgi:hypothetical protein